MAAVEADRLDVAGPCSIHCGCAVADELGLVGIWLAMFADYLVQGVLILLRFQSGKWQAIEG